MTKTIEPLVPKIEDNLTRREFLIEAGGRLILAPGCENGGDVSSGETRTIKPTNEKWLRRLAEGQ